MEEKCLRKYLFVLNPIAGGRKKEEVPRQILEFCNQSSCLYRIYETTGKKDLESVKEIYDEIKPDAVIAIGGDGTVNLVGNLLSGTPTPLGIIPLGSANGLARDLGLPLTVPEAFQTIEKFKPGAIDTLSINGRNCFHLSDFGFNARICHRFAQSILRGKLSYAWYGLQEFFTYKSFPYEIHTAQNSYTGEAFMMILSNANKFGTNISINPLGEIDDGWFEISILKPFPRFLGPYIFFHLLNNTIYRTPYYKVIRAQKATIVNKLNECYHIDGEPMDLADTIEVVIMPKALNVLLP
jgi:diacylglycerol kinase (ATP)